MLKNNYVEFDTQTGEIVSTVLSRHEPLPSSVNHEILQVSELVDSALYYVDVENGNITPKITFTIPDLKTTGYFTMVVPNDTSIVWYGDEYIIDDGLIELTVDEVGILPLSLNHPHYISETINLENS